MLVTYHADDIQSEVAEGRDAGPTDSKSSLRVSEDTDMEIDTEHLEDFLKGIMENDASAEAAAGNAIVTILGQNGKKLA